MQDGFEAEVEELHHVPPAPQVVPLKSFDLQAKNCTVSVVFESASEAVELNVCKAPFAIGFVETVAVVKLGAWFTKNGKSFTPPEVPWFTAEQSELALLSHTKPYQALLSTSAAEVW